MELKKLSFASVNMCGREKNECLLVWGLLMSEYRQCENIILREKCVCVLVRVCFLSLFDNVKTMPINHSLIEMK